MLIMSASCYQQSSPILCVVDDGQLHPHLQTTLHPADNYYDSSSTNILTSMSHSMSPNFSWLNDNFSTFEDFSQYYDSHQQHHQGNAPNVLSAVSEKTESTLSTFSPKGMRQNTKGRQRNRRNDKIEDKVIVEKMNYNTRNTRKKGEERRIYGEEDAAGCRDGCVYLRAKRGQAIDSHSLAERVRRQKLSDKMKLLQSLVPGCDKIAGKILILDNIIDYIHSLQDQVKFLMTEIALVDPTFDVNYLAVESTVTQLEKSYATTAGSKCTRITGQYQSIPLHGSSAQASALPSHWLALLEEREYTL